MALELQVSTQNAQKALDQISTSIDLLIQRFERVGASTGGFDAFVQKVTAFRGVPSEALASLTALGNATAKLGNVGALNGIASALNNLSKINVSAVSAGVERLNTALSRIVVPPGLTSVIQELNILMRAANSAGPAVQRLAASLNAIQVPAGLAGLSSQLTKVTTQATQAAGAMERFGQASGLAGQMAQAFGIAVGAMGFAQFIKGAFEGGAAVDKFMAQMSAVLGSQKEAAKAYEFIQQTAKDTATSIAVLSTQYGRWTAASKAANIETADSNTTFKQLAGAFRVMQLSADQTAGSFRAFEQMMSKGKVQAEELRGQLGDRFPGAFQEMAKAIGVTTQELGEMMKAGELGVDAVARMAQHLQEVYGKSLPAAVAVASAQLQLLANSFENFQRTVGLTMNAMLIPAFQALTKAMDDPAFHAFGKVLGTVIGGALNLLITGVAVLVDGLGVVASIVSSVVEALRPFGQMLADIANATGLTELLGSFDGLGKALYGAVAAATALAIGIGVLAVPLGLLTAGLRLATGAAVGLSAAMSPIALTIAGVMIAAGALAIIWAEYPGIADAISGAFSRLWKWILSVDESLTQLIYLGWDKAVDLWNRALDTAAGYVQTLVDWFNRLMDVGRSVGSAIASAFRSIVGYINSAISAVNSFISSLMRAIGLSSQVSGSGGGGGSGDTAMEGSMFAGEFSKGGRSNQPVSRQVVPMSAFAGAPHFATGGVTGGGIPAVLHDDEAVVPLSGGRSIPVQMAGGGGQAALLQKIWVSVREGNQTSAVVGQRVLSVGVVLKTEMDRHLDVLNAILGAINAGVIKICAELYKAQQPAAQTAAAGAVGAAGGLVGFNNLNTRVTSNSANGPTMTTSNNSAAFTPRNYQQAIKTGLGGAGGSVAGGVIKDVDGSYYAVKSIAGEKAQDNWLKYFGYKSNSFAQGTPNTSGGGMPVTVHPDEAIIPLSGGRTVPVELRGNESILQQIKDTIAGSMSGAPVSDNTSAPRRQGGESVRPSIVVHMNITTPDANSFNKSKDQLMADLQTRLNRAQKKLGRADNGADDPTRLA